MSDNENKEVEQQGNTIVVNMHTDKYDVYIGRAGRGRTGYYGNPFDVRVFGRENSLERYRIYFMNRLENEPGFKDKILELRGKHLGCFCKPRECHGDIIVAWLEAHEQDWDARARQEASKPAPESVKKAKNFHLKALAMKMTPEPIVTALRTEEQRDQEQSLEKAKIQMAAQENIGGNRV